MTTSEVLARQRAGLTQLPYADNIKFLKNEAGRMPILEDMQFRTETDEWILKRQELAMRFSLNSNDERKAYDRMVKADVAIYNIKLNEYLTEKLEQVYSNMLDYYYAQEELKLIVSELDILRDQAKVNLRLLSNSDEVNISKWLDIEDDIMSVATDSFELQKRLDYLHTSLGLDQSDVVLSFNDWISLPKVKQVVAGFTIEDASSLKTNLLRAEQEKAKAEYALEDAESRKWLDFVQVRYQSDDDVSFQRELTFGSSININNKGTNKVNRNKAALDVWDAKNELFIEREKSNERQISNLRNLESSIAELEYFTELADAQKLQESYDQYLAQGIANPLILLDIKNKILRNEKRILAREKNVYDNYLDAVFSSSNFGKSAIDNYLSNDVMLRSK